MLQALSYYIGHIPEPLEAYLLYDTWYIEVSCDVKAIHCNVVSTFELSCWL